MHAHCWRRQGARCGEVWDMATLPVALRTGSSWRRGLCSSWRRSDRYGMARTAWQLLGHKPWCVMPWEQLP